MLAGALPGADGHACQAFDFVDLAHVSCMTVYSRSVVMVVTC